MGISKWILLLFTHPNEFRILLQWHVYYERKRDTTSPILGWDRTSMQRCWALLDLTSRSFSPIIKEQDGDLARAVCIFYLVLRGLDTIEDDMTLPDEVKQPMLRSFHKLTVTPGWKFDGSGPDEKDRQLLVEYDNVVEELNTLLPAYRDIIVDTTEKMATGMADYAHKAATTGATYIETITEYDLYCHYVAGLVGEGLSCIYSASGKEDPSLKDQLELPNSMGLFLQKANIVRDYREDTDERRYFWPREIWGRKEYGFTALEELSVPHAQVRAVWVLSAMIVDALRHAPDTLDYLRLLRNQSMFNFSATVITAAIATMELCFMNPAVFERSLKIRRAEAARLGMRSTNAREVAIIFCEYARRIHAKAVPSDPNYLRISIACGRIEQWCEQHYPSFVQLSADSSGKITLDSNDARAIIVHQEQSRDQALAKKKRVEEIRAGMPAVPKAARELTSDAGAFETTVYLGGGLLLIVSVACSIIWVILWQLGEMPNLTGQLVDFRRSLGGGV